MGTSVKIKKLYEQMRHKLIFTVCCCSVIRSAYKHKYMCDWVCVFGVSVVVVPSSEKRRTSLHFIFGSLIVIQCEKLFLCTSNDFVWNHCRHYVFHVHYVSLPLPNDNAKGAKIMVCMMITFDDSNTLIMQDADTSSQLERVRLRLLYRAVVVHDQIPLNIAWWWHHFRELFTARNM